jgi:energy-coupling factor transporter ATP-binding protein EcfA2
VYEAYSIQDMSDSQSSSSAQSGQAVPSVRLTELHLTSGDVVSLKDGDIVIVVGPNNAGKTALIRAIDEKLRNPDSPSPVLSSLSHTKQGATEDLIPFIARTGRIRKNSSPTDPVYRAYGQNLATSTAKSLWKEDSQSLGTMTRFFCHYLTTEDRLSASSPAPGIALSSDSLDHPIHFIARDDSIEKRLSELFRQAFGMDLIVHRNAGTQIPLYTGERPIPDFSAGEDRVSISYIRRLEEQSPLAEQGDGMRSFASVLLHAAVGQEGILLIDEPESFLHPPQARLLGRLLVSEKPEKRQLFVATHSGDVVRGILDSGSQSARVIRLSREGNTTSATELSNAEIEALWSDSLLRHSNILDGLFHSRVVVCESDSDARFYSAVASAIEDESQARLDIMFTHSGGKQRLPVVARALSQVKVPVRVAADFDILREENLLRKLVAAVDADWSKLEGDWAQVSNAIAAKKPELDAAEVAIEIRKLLDDVQTGLFPKAVGEKIRKILARSSPWSAAKVQGTSYVPSGTPAIHCEALLEGLASNGILVVPEGEMEGFVRTIGGHGQKWVNEVLQLDLATDTKLEEARRFIQALVE